MGKSLHCGFCGKSKTRQGNLSYDWPFGIILIIDPKTCATARGKDISVNYSVFDKYFTETVFHITFGHVFPWLLLGDWLII